ncbi:hypothetical protein LEMLEM_LOCUS16477, partial [Lemmus lemmus]
SAVIPAPGFHPSKDHLALRGGDKGLHSYQSKHFPSEVKPRNYIRGEWQTIFIAPAHLLCDTQALRGCFGSGQVS